MRSLLVPAVCLVLLLTAGGVSAASSTAEPPPLIGANDTHYAYPDCGLQGTGIIKYYGWPGIRQRVRAQLAAMRAAGIQTLRLLLWHKTNPDGEIWGVVPSGGGRLGEPYRTNLIRYLRDVRQAGFEQLTVSFAPQGTNDPFDPGYYPLKRDENWAFIQSVRPLLKTFGPTSVHIDLINEGAPSGNSPTVQEYIADLYTRYVRAYGNADVTVSVALGDRDDPVRLKNLVEILRSTGAPLPRWFEIHLSYDSATALNELRESDAVLTAAGLTQPLVIGETAYDDRLVASAIKTFTQTSTRPVSEVIEWPQKADDACPVSAPYRADSYITELTGSPAPPPTPDPLPLPPVPRLYASVGPGAVIALKTATGQPVTSLDAGPYQIDVVDRSSTDNFHLIGPDVNRRTGTRFTGHLVWRSDLGTAVRYGTRYSYRSDRLGSGLRHTFILR